MVFASIPWLALSLAAASAPSTLPLYLSISSSPTSPCFPCEGPTFVGDKTLYVWFGYDHFEEIAFDFVGTFALVDFLPAPGVVNVGGVLSPVLVPDGSDCSADDMTLLGEVTVRDETGAGGAVWVEHSSSTSRLCFRECQQDGWFRFEYYGYSTDGTHPKGVDTSPDCRSVSVDGVTWGRVKARYRRSG